MRFSLITNDVECTSIINHKLDPKTAKYVLEQGMPRLLDLYAKFEVKATFFYTGKIAELVPKVVKMAFENGHEIGSHGYSHEVNQAFDVLNYKDQIVHLTKSKEILENIIGEEIISFRAPAARVNHNTVSALLETGFRVDSSVSSQRIDMFMSFGALKKLNWLTAPRLPYFTDENNIFKKGSSDLLEIPISAFGFPYIGTFMRIAPGLNRMTRNLLHLESKINGRPFVFLTHPNEFIDELRENQFIQRRAHNYFSYLLGDVLRHKLKAKNLGEKAIPLLMRELEFFKLKKYEYLTCKGYYNKLKK
ncbi:MAG: polysaccharide deacetylase family protein [Ignavibacteria bacterium]|nr:polysaccharide deacetylase family protein [Ignavibacteria bacterium]